jgi:hypothetical protein
MGWAVPQPQPALIRQPVGRQSLSRDNQRYCADW